MVPLFQSNENSFKRKFWCREREREYTKGQGNSTKTLLSFWVIPTPSLSKLSKFNNPLSNTICHSHGKEPFLVHFDPLCGHSPWNCLLCIVHCLWVQENKGREFYCLFGIVFRIIWLMFLGTLQRKDLKLDGRLCYLPGSRAFGLGIAALICLSAAQIIGNFVICKSLCLRDRRTSCKAKKTTIASTFLVLSW